MRLHSIPPEIGDVIVSPNQRLVIINWIGDSTEKRIQLRRKLGKKTVDLYYSMRSWVGKEEKWSTWTLFPLPSYKYYLFENPGVYDFSTAEYCAGGVV